MSPINLFKVIEGSIKSKTKFRSQKESHKTS